MDGLDWILLRGLVQLEHLAVLKIYQRRNHQIMAREGLGPQQLGGIFAVFGGAAVISLMVAVVQTLVNKYMMWHKQSN